MYTPLVKRSSNLVAGFTIIEVLIVLAIAGLIILTVFIAVPYLEVMQRNTARKQDAANLSQAINEYIADDGSVLPGMEGGTQNETDWVSPDCPALAKTVGKLAEFGTGGNISSMCTGDATQATTNNDFVMFELTSSSEQIGLGHNPLTNWLVYVTGAVCPTPTPETILTITQGSARQSLLIYPWENYGGSDDLLCLQVTT